MECAWSWLEKSLCAALLELQESKKEISNIGTQFVRKEDSSASNNMSWGGG